MNWLRFGNPEFLFFSLFGLPIIFILLLFGLSNKRKALLLFKTNANASHVNRQRVQTAVFFLIFLLISVSLTFPQWGAKKEEVAERLDIMIALDISTSMLAKDSNSMRRLTQAKDVIFVLLDRLQGNRVGLLYFAEASVVVCPFTNDVNTIREFLSALKPEFLIHRGTRIGNAIDIAKDRFIENSDNLDARHSNSSGQKVLILFTDGEDHGEGVSDSVKAAKMEGISIYCVGLGDSGKSVPIPLPDESLGYKRDKKGQLVLTTLDEEGLFELAKSGDGNYYHADIGVSQLMSDFSRIEKQTYKISSDGELRDRFQWFIFFTIVLLVGELLMQHWRMRTDN